MAALEEEAGVSEGENKSDFNEVVKLVWGETVNEDLLRRWSQGFVFSVDEPSALVQEQGGPCAVIASVQAYLIKNMLFSEEKSTELENWRQLAGDQAQDFLVLALLEILKLSKSKQYILVILRDHLTPVPEMVSDQESDESIGQCSADSNTPMSESGKTAEYHKKVCSQELRSFTSDSFHASLSQVCCPGDDDLTKMIKKNLQLFEGQFGVLLFLYSVILTKGIQNIKLETEDPEDQLVDQNFGHGSQALTNLMLTGHAVSNVWDLNRDVSGYELKGIPEQSSLGYLTLLEALRYCEVGSFLKSPKCPIWLLGSETHITVFFTMDRTLSRSENPRDKAIRVFKTYDKQENGFVESDKLTNILQELDLETDPAYVTFMRSRLDTDQIGIILLPNFLEEFFPGQNYYQDVKPFKVYHYNGLGSSSTEQVRKVVYTEGLASVEWTDIQSVTEEPIITCLRTKWPGITIDWKVTNAPSLN